MKKLIVGFTAAALMAGSVPAARAGEDGWDTAGKVLTGVFAASVIARAFEAPPAYCAPAVTYSVPVTYGYCPPPVPVVIAPCPPPPPIVRLPVFLPVPRPVVLVRRPLVVAPAPICVPVPVVRFGHGHRHGHH